MKAVPAISSVFSDKRLTNLFFSVKIKPLFKGNDKDRRVYKTGKRDSARG